MKSCAFILSAMVAMLLCSSCNDEVTSNRYCSLPAKFSFSPVMSMQPLNSACNNLGEWCTITLTDKKFVFKSLNNTSTANQTAMSGYTGFYMGLAGFIVGLPDIPEMGADGSVVTCYDLACSNCYHNDYVQRSLTLKSGGFADCSRCGRTYNLNNIGIVSQGEGGINLYRYRVYYGGDGLLINN